MKTQINLRLPGNLRRTAEKYAKKHHYKNLQELTADAIREKVMKIKYDESFTEKEIDLIDKLITFSIKHKKLKSEKELMKALE